MDIQYNSNATVIDDCMLCFLFLDSHGLKTSTVTTHQVSTSGSQTDGELKVDHDDQKVTTSSAIDRIHEDMSKMEKSSMLLKEK